MAFGKKAKANANIEILFSRVRSQARGARENLTDILRGREQKLSMIEESLKMIRTQPLTQGEARQTNVILYLKSSST